MVGIATALKRMGGAFFVGLLLCLAFAPTADSLVCSTDVPMLESLAAPDIAPIATTLHAHDDADRHGENQRDGGDDACVHGHCHQAASPAAPVVITLAEASVTGLGLTPSKTGLPPSRSPDGPMEPPRA
ncbi:MAG: hypothetical protein J7521_17025 [Caulobacter sp.]|nr:hypothetical protein [Caulobacter sp.]